MDIEISPSTAAELAFAVYTVKGGSTKDLSAFLSNKVFARGTGQSVLQGEVGRRIFKAADDGFGLCAKGAGQYKGELFIIFRGTTKANNNADTERTISI